MTTHPHNTNHHTMDISYMDKEFPSKTAEVKLVDLAMLTTHSLLFALETIKSASEK